VKMREVIELVKEMAGESAYAVTFEIASWANSPRCIIYLADKGGHSEGKDWDEVTTAAKAKVQGYHIPISDPLPDEEES
jgi:hypothetical protein